MAAAIGNQYALGNKGGRPLKFSSVKELQAGVDAFFESCYEIDEETGKKIQIEPFTITGLALALDTSRETLMDIENCNAGYSKEFSDCIVRAKLKCHNYAEKQLYTAKSAQGPIFALKQYGWKDTQNVEVTGPNGQPLQIQTLNSIPFDDLLKLEEIMAKAQIQGEVVDIESSEDK